MSTEYRKQLLERSEEGLACARNMLDLIEAEMNAVKEHLKPEEWSQLEEALADARKDDESAQQSLMASEERTSIVEGIPDETMKAARSRVAAQLERYQEKTLQLTQARTRLKEQSAYHRQALKDDQRRFHSVVEKQEERIAALAERIHKLEIDSVQGNMPHPPIIVISPPVVETQEEHNAQGLTVPNPVGADSGVSGISRSGDGSSRSVSMD